MLIAIRPGRALRCSPPWNCSDSAVLFDASSGDYWVLTPEAREVVQTLQDHGAMPLDTLLARLPRPAHPGPTLIDQLAQAGLLSGLVDGLAVPLPRAEAED